MTWTTCSLSFDIIPSYFLHNPFLPCLWHHLSRTVAAQHCSMWTAQHRSTLWTICDTFLILLRNLPFPQLLFVKFQGIYDAGVSFRWILISYAIVAIFCVLCTTFILLPKTSIAVEQVESNKQKSAVELGVANPGVTADNVGDQQMTLESVVDLRDGDNFDDITKQSATGWCA